MKKILSFSVLMAVVGTSMLSAQSYVDDRYMNNNLPEPTYQNNANTDQYAEGQYDNSYIDYDDDSYTTRMRRFNYPMMGTGYFGSIYSPYYYDPFFYDPFVSWGGWYRPRVVVSFGFGPYWSNCWGTSIWTGYQSFGLGWGYSPYHNPWNSWGFGGYGMGYGGGFWNGYYAGLYDGMGHSGSWHHQNYRANYGPRGYAGTNVNSTGSYGLSGRNTRSGLGLDHNPRGQRTQTMHSNSRINPIRNNESNPRGAIINNQNGRIQHSQMNTPRSYDRGNQIDIRSNDRNSNMRGNQMEIRSNDRNSNMRGNQMDMRSNDRMFESAPSRSSYPRQNMSAPPQRSSAPSRSYSAPSAPSRSYSAPSAPSRSFSAPSAPSRSFSAPSRSSGGGSFGGSRR